MGDYRQRDHYQVCCECGRTTDDMHQRWHRVYCSRCLPVVVARRGERSQRDKEYVARLRCQYGIATAEDREFLAQCAQGG